MQQGTQQTNVVVVGGGPGGYVAAIRAADLGHETVLVEQRDRLGGVCLLEGCIPSKALITAVEVVDRAREAERMGITFKDVRIDLNGLRSFTEGVIDDLTRGVDTLLKKRGITVVKGRARLSKANELTIDGEGASKLSFRHAILATGSGVLHLPLWKDLDVWTSTEALAVPSVPERLLVVGGGYIGLELGFVYAGLGSRVTVVELLPQLLSGADPDLVRPVAKRCKKKFESVLLNTRLTRLERRQQGFMATMVGQGGESTSEYDQVLVAVGRRPNTDDLGLGELGIALDDQGRVVVDEKMRTNVPGVFAIGDIVPGPGLAHKASREGKVAAEVIAGRPAAFDNVSIPAVVFTDPELAWTGLTEQEARDQQLTIKVGKFPLTALGRARTLGRTDGLVKIVVAADTDRILGVGVVGPHASELISEAVLALELGAVLEDLTATIHPHPTLSESLMEAAEVAEGMPVHVLPPKKQP